MPALLATTLFVITTFAIVLPVLGNSLLQSKREMIRELTNSAWSILAGYEDEVRAGLVSREEAKALAISRIAQLHYGAQQRDYFWITDMHPRMIMHPYRPDLDGHDLSDFQDMHGTRLFAEFVKVAREQGEGYVDYYWQWKDNPDRVAPKESFVKRFAPWDWVIGTGIYLDDVHQEISALTGWLIWLCAGVSACILLLLAYVSRESLRAETKRKQAEKKIREDAERLLALNEELISANEELTATYQEMEAQYEELVATEDELQESQEKYRTVADFTYDWEYWIDTDGRLLYCSPSCERITGYRIDEFIEDPNLLAKITRPDDRHLFEQHSCHALGDDISVSAELEFRIVTRNGDERWIAHVCQPVLTTDGAYRGRRASNRDITERKQTERTIRQERDLFLAGPAIAFKWINAENWPVEYVSPNISQLGYRVEDWLSGRVHYAGIIHEDDVARVADEVRAFSEDGRSCFEQRYRIYTADLEVRWVYDYTNVIRNEQGEITHYHGFLLDITERKQAEEKIRESAERLLALNEELTSANEELTATYEEMEAQYEELVAAEDELKESQEWYRTVADFTFDWEYWLDPDGRLLYCSPSCERITGHSVDEFMAEPALLRQVTHPDDRYMIDQIFDHTLKATTEVLDLEFRIFNRMGEVHWIGHISYPVYAEDHSFRGRRASNRDVTKRKQAEEALHAKTDELQRQNIILSTQMESSIDGILVVDEDAQIVSYNQRFVKMWDIPQEVIESRSDELAIQAVLGKLAQPEAFQANVRDIYDHRFETSREEIDLVDGRIFDRYSAPMSGPDSQYFGRVWFFRDITDRKLAEKTLCLSEDKYRQLVEMANEGIWVVDRDNVTTFVNPAMAKMLGYEPHSIRGHRLTEFMFPEDYHRQDEIICVRKSGASSTYERRYIRANGAELWCQVSGTPILGDDGQFAGSFGMLTDITERKRAESERDMFEEYLRQSQKMEAIGTLAGGIAHDFNNLLFGILGYGELVLDNLEPDSLDYHNMKALLAAGGRAKQLVQQILTFSRKTLSEKVPLDLSLYIKEVAKLLRATLPSTLEIRQNMQPVTTVVMADPTEIHQILMNLCTNAAHAIGEGKGVMEISLRETEVTPETPMSRVSLAQGVYLVLSVSDTGKGMPPEIQARIFEPFFTTKVQGKGTGLGLSVVHGIVKSLGGEIIVESKVGEGSCFTIYFPAIGGRHTVESSETGALPSGTARILVVDDEVFILGVLRQSLAALGYLVTCCESGLEALALLKEQPGQFDVLITDQTMPQLTGMELAQKALELQPELPVLLCTGYSETITQETIRHLGIAELLYKPIHKADLANALHRVLQNRE